MRFEIRLGSENPDLLVGLAAAEGVRVAPAGEALRALLDDLLARRREDFPPEPTRRAIRDLLRWGGFKPTGRSKPASEYLARAAAAGTFPRINNVVDAANYVSLATGLPISLLDRERALEGAAGLELREGREGESFVFNAAGQEIDVAGLLCVARLDGPALGNAVKDSLATKTTPETRSVLAVVYASRRLSSVADVARLVGELAGLLAAHAGARETDAWAL